MEMVAVLALLGLIGGMATMSLRGLHTYSDAGGLLDAMVGLDATARERSRRDGLTRHLVFDLQKRRVWCEVQRSEVRSEAVEPSAGTMVTWRPSLDLDAVRIFGVSEQSVTDGQAVVVIRTDGTSDDYALAITARSAEGDVGSELFRGVAFAGWTGQSAYIEGKEAFDAFAESLASARADAR